MAEFIVREVKEIVTESSVVARDAKNARDQFVKNQVTKVEKTVFVTAITEEVHITVRESKPLYLEVNNND